MNANSRSLDNDYILFEYPLMERMRLYLRLEILYQRLCELIERETDMDHHFAVVTLCEMVGVISNTSSLSSDLLLDLDRQKIILSSLRNNPHIAQDVLQKTLSDIEHCAQSFGKQSSKSTLVLNDDHFLNTIRKKFSAWGLPFGSADFPTYYHWLNLPADERRQTLQQWVHHLMPLAQSILLLLKMLRESGTPKKIHVSNGQYEQPLSENKSYRLLRVKLDKSLGLLPEISASSRALVIRLLRMNTEGGHITKPAHEHAHFELTLCGG